MNNEPEQAKSQSGTLSTNPIIINNNPSVNAGLDRSVYEGTNGVTLKGTGKDPDHNALRYSWEQTGGDSVVLNDANTPKPTFNAPDVDEDKVLTFKLTVVDEKGGQGSDDVKIRIKDKPVMNNEPEQAKSQSSTLSTNPIIINNNPSVNAGLDRSVYEGTNGVTLKGTGKDPDHNALRYSWEQTGGDSVVLNDANTPKPTFNAPDVDEDKVLTFKLTVVDEKGGQGSDDVKIRIKDKPVMNNQIPNDQFYRDRNPNSPDFNVTSLQAH